MRDDGVDPAMQFLLGLTEPTEICRVIMLLGLVARDCATPESHHSRAMFECDMQLCLRRLERSVLAFYCGKRHLLCSTMVRRLIGGWLDGLSTLTAELGLSNRKLPIGRQGLDCFWHASSI